MDTKTTQGSPDTGILFSRTVKAGQRIYYVDVKENRRGEKYLSITESKKMVSNDEENPHVRSTRYSCFPRTFRNSWNAWRKPWTMPRAIPRHHRRQMRLRQERYT